MTYYVSNSESSEPFALLSQCTFLITSRGEFLRFRLTLLVVSTAFVDFRFRLLKGMKELEVEVSYLVQRTLLS